MKKTLLLVVTILVGFAFLEFIIYKIAPQKTTYYNRSNVPAVYALGDRIPTKVAPNLRQENITNAYQEYVITVTTDNFGFRSTKPADITKPTVLVLGDSQTFGWGVSDNEPYANLLNAHYEGCQIINAGVPGPELNYYFAYLREIVEDYGFTDIKQVIIGLNLPGNDYYGLQEFPKKVDPELEWYWDRMPVIKNGIGVSPEPQGLSAKIRKQSKDALRYSQTYTFLRLVVAPALKHAVLNRVDTETTEREEYEKTGKAMETIVLDMKKYTEEHGIALAFLFLPERPFYFQKPPLYYERLISFFDTNKIPLGDMFPVLKNAFTTFTDFWLPVDGHYNERAHKLIASTVIKQNLVTCD